MLRVVGLLFAVWTHRPDCGGSGQVTPPPHEDTSAGKLTMSLFGHFTTPAAARDDAPVACAAETSPVVPTPAVAMKAGPIRGRSMLAARLRCTAKLNRNSARVRAGRMAKSTRHGLKRAPQLYPVKLKKAVAKRAKTKIIVTRPKLKSAIILRFPSRVANRAPQRHKPAA